MKCFLFILLMNEQGRMINIFVVGYTEPFAAISMIIDI